MWPETTKVFYCIWWWYIFWKTDFFPSFSTGRSPYIFIFVCFTCHSGPTERGGYLQEEQHHQHEFVIASIESLTKPVNSHSYHQITISKQKHVVSRSQQNDYKTHKMSTRINGTEIFWGVIITLEEVYMFGIFGDMLRITLSAVELLHSFCQEMLLPDGEKN